ncbi:MAG: hypothetical protein RLZZ501_2646, partial [Pseudomonadota bacterium]
MSTPLWQPGPERIAAARLTAFIDRVNHRHGLTLADMADLWRWSVAQPDRFWDEVWAFTGVIGDRGDGSAVDDPDRLPGAIWFPQARLNFAENLLRRRDDADALVFWGEDEVRRRLSFGELYALVSRLAAAMRAHGVGCGDRVAGFLPNLPETIAAMLAAASLGAVWSSASPDFGVRGVVDRFGQIAPRLLLAVDGYWYNGQRHDVRPKLAGILAGLPSVETLVVVPYLDPAPDLSGLPRAVGLDSFLAPHPPGEICFERLPFNHPLYILYSSGTTGLPKAILHGAGGVLLQHLKEHQL